MIIVKTLMSTFFTTNVFPLDTDYISPDDFSGTFKDFTGKFILSPTSQY